MQLVHHYIAQSLRAILFPELAVFWTQHQIVQHFVVGEQYVWRIFAHGVAVGDNALWRHTRALSWLGLVPAHIHAYPKVFESGNGVN